MGIFEVFENSDISRRAEEQVQELMNETKEIEDRAIKTIAEIDGVSEEYARLRQKEQIGTISEAEKERYTELQEARTEELLEKADALIKETKEMIGPDYHDGKVVSFGRESNDVYFARKELERKLADPKATAIEIKHAQEKLAKKTADQAAKEMQRKAAEAAKKEAAKMKK